MNLVGLFGLTLTGQRQVKLIHDVEVVRCNSVRLAKRRLGGLRFAGLELQRPDPQARKVASVVRRLRFAQRTRERTPTVNREETWGRRQT